MIPKVLVVFEERSRGYRSPSYRDDGLMLELDPQVLEHLRDRLPSWVRSIEPRESLDPEGASVIVLFLVVDENATVFEEAESLSEARDAVAQVFTDQRVGLWPYVRFVRENEWRRAAQA